MRSDRREERRQGTIILSLFQGLLNCAVQCVSPKQPLVKVMSKALVILFKA